MEKKLGKITKAYFGIGGYNDCEIGIFLEFSSGCWGVSGKKSAWDHNLLKWSENCRWTEEDRGKQYVDIVKYTSDILNKAKVHSVDKLVGIPVEITFESNTLKDWRVLEEVL